MNYPGWAGRGDLNLRTWDNLHRLPMFCECCKKSKKPYWHNLHWTIWTHSSQSTSQTWSHWSPQHPYKEMRGTKVTPPFRPKPYLSLPLAGVRGWNTFIQEQITMFFASSQHVGEQVCLSLLEAIQFPSNLSEMLGTESPASDILRQLLACLLNHCLVILTWTWCTM